MTQPTPASPAPTIGLLGGGQLGRMMIQAAHALGLRVVVLDPQADAPACQIADEVVIGAYDDLAALDQLAAKAQVFTTEFENVPADSLRRLSAHGPCMPSADAIEVCQDRLREKQTLQQAGVPVAPFAAIDRAEQLLDVALCPDALFPGILKTRRFGYDGKGQARVASRSEAMRAFEGMGAVPCVLEQRVPLAKEVSVILARNPEGDCAVFPLAENRHVQGILDETDLPGDVPEAVAQAAQASALRIAQTLNYVGVLCVEFFITEAGELLANEMAPRPHNSGHATIEACTTSQFAQQARICAGLRLGPTDCREPHRMKNLLGDLWLSGDPAAAGQAGAAPEPGATEPPWSRLVPEGATLHLYGKHSPRPGRKMGHITGPRRVWPSAKP